jgi:hypothetical protein
LYAVSQFSSAHGHQALAVEALQDSVRPIKIDRVIRNDAVHIQQALRDQADIRRAQEWAEA